MEPFWLTAFLDLPAERFESTVRFWSQVTGYVVSPPRGARKEFASLVPPEGDEHLRVQRLSAGGARVHLDVHVSDPRQAAALAASLGAREVADHGHVIMSSPAGLDFCFVSHSAAKPAPAASWPHGRSIVDQVSLDIPSGAYDLECDFWAQVLASRWQPSPSHPEFRRIRLPGVPVGVLLQRLDETEGEAGAHLDLAADDPDAEVLRHLELGARVESVHGHWTVLRDPAGSAYCITVRRPTVVA